VAILAVGNMATHWKATAVPRPPDVFTAASRRDLEAVRRLRDGEVHQLVWTGERGVFLAFGAHGTAEDADPADALIKAAATRVEPRRARR
jgi:hypothetical protein